jgi:hypothetical protein
MMSPSPKPNFNSKLAIRGPSHRTASRISRPDSSFRSSTNPDFRGVSLHTGYARFGGYSLRSSIGLRMVFSWGSACSLWGWWVCHGMRWCCNVPPKPARIILSRNIYTSVADPLKMSFKLTTPRLREGAHHQGHASHSHSVTSSSACPATA